ncbi:hypothetical protein CZ771_13305 [Actinomycetales bacterium JB111]|nr:hypothetical protein CZ771_13305 [Actinomycetales bacterium JB111]
MDDPIATFIDRATPAKRARDARRLVELMREATGEDPVLRGTIIGFGEYHYRYDSGREGDAPAAGFSPRRQASTIYLLDGVAAHADALARLGPHTTGIGCVYVKDLDDVDLTVLAEIVTASYRTLTSGTFGARARDAQGGS